MAAEAEAADTSRIDLTMAEISYGWSIGLHATRAGELIERVERGFEAGVVDRFREKLDLSAEETAALLRTSTRTLLRRQKQGRLDEQESDLLYRFVQLYERAVEVLGGEDEARLWLKQPQWGLGGAIPLHYARTEPGAHEVEILLDRIDYGVLP